MRLARNNTSGCKGVVRLPGNKGYQVQIRKKGMPRRIGKFLTYEAAVDAAVTAIKERHGEFARPEIKRKEEAA